VRPRLDEPEAAGARGGEAGGDAGAGVGQRGLLHPRRRQVRRPGLVGGAAAGRCAAVPLHAHKRALGRLHRRRGRGHQQRQAHEGGGVPHGGGVGSGPALLGCRRRVRRRVASARRRGGADCEGSQQACRL